MREARRVAGRPVRARTITRGVIFLLVAAGFPAWSAWAGQECPAAPAGFHPSIAFSAGMRGFFDHDSDAIYGVLPAVGLRVSLPTGRAGEFFAGITRVADSESINLRTTGFTGSADADYEAISFESGIRLNLSKNDDQRLYFGFSAGYDWIAERIEGTAPHTGDLAPEYTGGGWRLHLLIGPEWRLGRSPYAIGAEFVLGGGSVLIEHDHFQREIETTGLGMSAYVVRRF